MKITLNIDKEIVEKVKIYAKNRNQSLSSLVQDYFKFLSEDHPDEDIEISQTIKELSGVIQLSKDFTIKKEYRKHILEKYST